MTPILQTQNEKAKLATDQEGLHKEAAARRTELAEVERQIAATTDPDKLVLLLARRDALTMILARLDAQAMQLEATRKRLREQEAAEQRHRYALARDLEEAEAQVAVCQRRMTEAESQLAVTRRQHQAALDRVARLRSALGDGI